MPCTLGTSERDRDSIQYNISRPEPDSTKIYGTRLTLVKEAFRIFKENTQIQDTLTHDHPVWTRQNLKVRYGNYYSYEDNLRYKSTYVAGLRVTKYLQNEN